MVAGVCTPSRSAISPAARFAVDGPAWRDSWQDCPVSPHGAIVGRAAGHTDQGSSSFRSYGPRRLARLSPLLVIQSRELHFVAENANRDDSKCEHFGVRLKVATKVFTFAIVTIGVFGDEVDLTRLDDKEWR